MWTSSPSKPSVIPSILSDFNQNEGKTSRFALKNRLRMTLLRYKYTTIYNGILWCTWMVFLVFRHDSFTSIGCGLMAVWRWGKLYLQTSSYRRQDMGTVYQNYRDGFLRFLYYEFQAIHGYESKKRAPICIFFLKIFRTHEILRIFAHRIKYW